MTIHKEIIVCKRCLSDSNDQRITFDDDGICNFCERYDIDKENFYFVDKNGKEKFSEIVNKIKKNANGPYDCIMGLSGGVDSTYLAYLLKEFDLNVLAVHVDAGWNTEIAVGNIQKIIKYTGYDLETIVLEWGDIRSLQVACLRAQIMNQDIVQDHAFFSALYKLAKDLKIGYVMTGSNMQTEGVWGYYGHSAMDSKYLKNVFKKFGKGKVKNYPFTNFLNYYFFYPYFHKIKPLKPFNYLGYNKTEAQLALIEKVGYTPYKYKHGESVWTRFFQDYYLIKKFNYDKRKIHLSSQLFNGDMSRSEALNVLKEDPYDYALFDYDVSYISRKLELSVEEFLSLLNPLEKDPPDFKSNERLYKFIKFLQKVVEKALPVKLSNYS